MVIDPASSAGLPHRDTNARIASIDLLRGLIMALMALDHTRAFILGFAPDPTDIDTTSLPLFTTRWITHLCAPGFLLLAGVAARLQRERREPPSLVFLLATRGAFLIVLELTIIGFAWIPDPSRSLMLLQVIWAIGWSMILLTPLVFMPAPLVGAIGVAVCLLHPALSVGLAASGAPTWASVILFDANRTLAIGDTTRLIVSYPILPWFGVMAAGYGLAGLILRRPDDWAGRVARLGLALMVGFVVLRASGLGLDPEPWRPDLRAWRSAMSFLNGEKYPPSPLFLMMTLGPLLLLLALFERVALGRAEQFLRPLGQAPLFFYVLHLYALRIVGLAAAAAVWGVGNLGPPPQHSAPGWSLWSVWLIWIVAMIALYPPTDGSRSSRRGTADGGPSICKKTSAPDRLAAAPWRAAEDHADHLDERSDADGARDARLRPKEGAVLVSSSRSTACISFSNRMDRDRFGQCACSGWARGRRRPPS